MNVIRALQSVADSSSTTTLAALTAALGHADPYVRVTAATAMADGFAWASAPGAEATSARGALERGLGDPDAATRGACGRALTTEFGESGYEVSRERLAKDPSPYARAALLEGLRGWLKRPAASGAKPYTEACSELLQGLHRDQPLIVRMTAADVAGAVGKRADKLSITLRDTLRAGLLDPDVLYASACAGALGEWGDTPSVRRLALAYAARGKDADADARQAIRDALRQLASKRVRGQRRERQPRSRFGGRVHHGLRAAAA